MKYFGDQEIKGVGLFFVVVVLSLVVLGVFLDKEPISVLMEPPEQVTIDHELDIDIVATGEQLDSSQQNILENQLEGDVEGVRIIDELEDGGTLEAPVQDQPEEKGLSPPAFVQRLSAPVRKGGGAELRIGFVTDTHVMSSGVGSARVLGKKYQDRLSYFIEHMNNVFGADLLIVNGDIIEGTRQPSEIGIAELSLVKKIFQRTSIPTYWVLGNHDLRSVTKKQWRSALGIDYEYTAFDVKGYRIFIVDSNFMVDDQNVAPGRSLTRGNVSQEQLEWLDKELKKTKKKPIVFVHHPPLRNINSKINEGLLKNALDLQRVFTEHGVMAVFMGHIEDLYYEKTGLVQYFVLPGLVKHPTYQGAFAEILFSGNTVEVDVSYLKNDGTYRTVQMKQK
ncbi:MAG: metallophosphoesterase [Candidatus Moranbacteria bacterium]|nr:metallophosphoesterase [Candidatus Moranbacteria bacterium]